VSGVANIAKSDQTIKSVIMNEWFNNHRRLLICIALAVTTFAVYLPVRNHEFINLDDDLYVTGNPEVIRGISWEGIRWAFTAIHSFNWHPLTWLSLMLDCELFGIKAGPIHIMNVLFHIANTILLFLVFARMTKGVWQSAFIAGLFALHPLHVESVAWVAERKDVLSTLFWLLTMMVYSRYAERPSAGRYIAVLVLFALGLMAKPMLVTLPFVLLLLDYWPLNRMSILNRQSSTLNSQFSILNLIIEKIPLIVLSVGSSAVTFIAQQRGGAMSAIPLNERITNAIYSYLIYIGKLFWPTRLAVLYPYPENAIPVSTGLICAVILILVTVFFVFYGLKRRYLITGWLWYLGTLVPVVGIVQVGAQSWADRYAYVPLIGLFLIIAFGFTDILKNVPAKKYILAPAAILILASCAVAGYIQVQYWKDSTSLFERTLAVTKDNAIICYNYASVLKDRGQTEKARQYFIEAVRLRPDIQDIHNGYGIVLEALGKTDEALEQYQIAVNINPRSDIARYNIGWVLLRKERYDEAMEQFRIYLGQNTDLPLNGVTEETTARFRKMLVSKPNTAEILSHVGFCFAQKQDFNTAVKYYRQALILNPKDISTNRRMGLALHSMGKTDEAIEQCRIVLTADPNDAKTYNNMGIMLQSEGKIDEAIDCFKKALDINPKYEKARNALNAAIVQKKGPN
jgi:tetratricopeptide (TPR) repeat protein